MTTTTLTEVQYQVFGWELPEGEVDFDSPIQFNKNFCKVSNAIAFLNRKACADRTTVLSLTEYDLDQGCGVSLYHAVRYDTPGDRLAPLVTTGTLAPAIGQ